MPVIGHDSTVRCLQTTLEQQRVHNAYLFVGIDGIGKRTLARWFAEQLLYVPKRRQLPLDGHPDFYTLEPLDTETGKRGVVKMEAVQSLISYLRQQPLVSTRSVILLDQADTFTHSAANALLKTLEEPRKAVLLLTTDQPDAVVTTVRSRCQTLYLSPLTTSECRTVLAPHVTDPPAAFVEWSPGQPGTILQHCRQLNALEPVRAALQQGITAAHECLGLAQSLKELTQTQQVWLLQWWQRSLVDQPHQLAHCDQAIAQLQQHVQPELVWDIFLLALSQQGSVALTLPAPVTLHTPVAVTAPVDIETTPAVKSRQTRQSNGSKKTKSNVETITPPTVEPTTETPPALKQLSLFAKR